MSNNKALEIYNGTGAAVDLEAGGYSVQLFANGSPTATSTNPLSGVVAPGDVYVIGNAQAVPAIGDESDVFSTATYFNGDDAIALLKGSTMLDVIGQIGVDPGAEWGTDPTSTGENTLRRMATICAGNPDGSDPFDPADEWVGFAQGTFDGLGAHTANCDAVVAAPVINEFLANHTGTDVIEYVEVLGAPNADLSTYSVLEIEGDSGSATGTVDEVIPLGTADGDGRYLASLPANALENGTITLLLVQGFTGTAGTDLDTNDDGTLDVMPWTAIVDSVAVNDGGVGDLTYGGPVLGVAYDGLPSAPGGASRLPDGTDTDTAADWMRSDFDLAGIEGFTGTPVEGEALNTPGAVNVAYEPPVGDAAPTVVSTAPASGATEVAVGVDISVTFSEPVDLADGWYTLGCDGSAVAATVSGEGAMWTIDPDADLSYGESCTLTIVAANVTDIDTDDPPDTMAADHVVTFETMAENICEAEYTPIYDIQGDGAEAAITGAVTTKGVVVGDFQSGGFDGYFLQDPTGDDDATTSDGIFIYAPGGTDVAEGDLVRVSGSAGEYGGMTQVTASAVVVCDVGGDLPAATEVTLPMDPEDYEPLEGMYVTLPQDLAILEYFNFDRYGEIRLGTDRQYQPTAVYEPGSAEALALAEANLLNSITLDDGRSSQNPDPAIHPNGEEFTLENTFRGGDLVANVTGVLDHRFNLWRIQPTEGADYTAVNPRPEVPEVGGTTTVASFNVLNYFTTFGSRGANDELEFERQEAKIVSAISELDADIVGLIEIENNGTAVFTLVDALNAVMGEGTYAAIDTGVIGTDEITTAFIYKPAEVTPVGEFAILDSTVDPLFLDDYNRPALAQTFADAETGEEVTVVVNHLKSKGSDCNAVDDPDLGDGQGNCNLTRTAAAEAMANWLATGPTGAEPGRTLIIGDLNAYDKEDPITALTEAGYTDLLLEFQGEYEYSYVFDGQLGYLDHALAGPEVLELVTGAAAWHINADEPDLIDYDMTFKQDAQDALYAPDAFRSSDHDPVLVGLDLTVPVEPTPTPTEEPTEEPTSQPTTPGPTVTPGPSMPDTGADVALFVLGALGLLAAGFALLAARRRMA